MISTSAHRLQLPVSRQQREEMEGILGTLGGSPRMTPAVSFAPPNYDVARELMRALRHSSWFAGTSGWPRGTNALNWKKVWAR